MVRPAVQREAVAHLQARLGLSERRACKIVGADRKMVRYQSIRPPETELRQRLRDLANEHRRFGYRRLFVLLRRDGKPSGINRLYREEGLTVRKRRAGRKAVGPRAPKGPAVCKGMTGIQQNLAEETVINGLQHELMQAWAYERFRKQVAQHLKEQSRAASDEQRLYERLILEKETTRGNLMTALKRGLIDDDTIAEVNDPNEEPKRLRAKLEGLTPEHVALPDDLT